MKGIKKLFGKKKEQPQVPTWMIYEADETAAAEAILKLYDRVRGDGYTILESFDINGYPREPFLTIQIGSVETGIIMHFGYPYIEQSFNQWLKQCYRETLIFYIDNPILEK